MKSLQCNMLHRLMPLMPLKHCSL